LLTKAQGCACVNARDLSRMSMPSEKKLAVLQHYLSNLLRNNDLIVLVDKKNLEQLSLEPSLSAVYSSYRNNSDL